MLKRNQLTKSGSFPLPEMQKKARPENRPRKSKRRDLQHGDKDRNDRAKQHHCRNHQAEDSNAFAHLLNPPNQRPTDA
ncbi:hypothetical protein SDC9_102518 [bioreactor metagenome]|uniref:Uncharacterized protein n=1 Tax=bioreactor metagenome TaxID=1076179 RepID=A0A645ATW1_9ZZZZ